MGRDCKYHARSCKIFQKSNKSTEVKAPLIEREILSVPFEKVCLDIVGPLSNTTGGFHYIFTYIDVATRWPKAVALRSTTSNVVADALIPIFARNGIPRCILTDNGSNFNSSILVQLCEALSIDKLNTTPYRPQANGILERFHGTLVPMLKKAKDKSMDWVTFLPIALYAICLTPSVATGYSRFALVHSRNMPSLVDLLHAGCLEKQCENSSVSE